MTKTKDANNKTTNEGDDAAPGPSSSSISKRAKKSPAAASSGAEKGGRRNGGDVFQWNTAQFWSEVAKQIEDIEKSAGRAHEPPPLTVQVPPVSTTHMIPLSHAERRYLDGQPPKVRKRILQSLQRSASPATPLRFRVSESALPPRIKTEMVSRLAGSVVDGGK